MRSNKPRVLVLGRYSERLAWDMMLRIIQLQGWPEDKP